MSTYDGELAGQTRYLPCAAASSQFEELETCLGTCWRNYIEDIRTFSRLLISIDTSFARAVFDGHMATLPARKRRAASCFWRHAIDATMTLAAIVEISGRIERRDAASHAPPIDASPL